MSEELDKDQARGARLCSCGHPFSRHRQTASSVKRDREATGPCLFRESGTDACCSCKAFVFASSQSPFALR